MCSVSSIARLRVLGSVANDQTSFHNRDVCRETGGRLLTIIINSLHCSFERHSALEPKLTQVK